jgi:hypothetical protein
MVERYLEAWAGIRLFDEDQYAPDRSGVLVDYRVPWETPISLEAAHAVRRGAAEVEAPAAAWPGGSVSLRMRNPVDVRDADERAALIRVAQAEGRSADEWYRRYRDARKQDQREQEPGDGDAPGATREQYDRRILALWGLIASGSPALQFAHGMLEDAQAEIREDGAGLAEGIGDPSIVDALIEAAKTEKDPQVLDAITQALTRFEQGSARARTYLTDLVDPS